LFRCFNNKNGAHARLMPDLRPHQRCTMCFTANSESRSVILFTKEILPRTVFLTVIILPRRHRTYSLILSAETFYGG
jgi:hypothetical protein